MHATLHINLAIVQQNWLAYNKLCGDSVTVSAVVKADAYACGMVQVATALYHVGCRVFWVATLNEALDLRKNLADKTVMIGVFEGIFNPTEYNKHNITGVINHPSQLIHSQSVPCFIHIDTGMSRLGLHHSTANTDIKNHISACGDTNIIGYMSHLHSAECTEVSAIWATHTQNDRLQNALQGLPKKSISLCNSDGALTVPEYHYHMVRIGIGLYGISTHTPLLKCAVLKCAVKCTAPLLNIIHIQPPESVGYNATYTADSIQPIGTLGIGYNDGIGTPYSNCTEVYYNGRACPVVGRVSMDSMCIDLSHVKNPQLGTPVTLFDSLESVHKIAQKTKFPPHAVVCTLGERVKKEYTPNICNP